MVKIFKYNFADLNVTIEDIAILMGYKSGEIPEPFPGLIEAGLKKATYLCDIRGGYCTFSDVVTNPSKNIIRINDIEFFPGKIVSTQLYKSKETAIFICTAGKAISDYSKELIKSGNSMEGYIMDVIGSVTVEKAMDRIESELQNETKERGLNISNRFSPGYCDWNVEEQQKLFSLIPKNFCGVTLSPASLMDPVKSVSGIIGIGEGLKQKGVQCRWCSDKDCIYGKIRRNV